MQISKNFALTCSARGHTSIDTPTGAVRLYCDARGKFWVNSVACASERDAFERLAQACPDFATKLGAGNGLVWAGLAERAQLALATSSDDEWLSLENTLKDAICGNFTKIADGIGATTLAKSISALRTRPSMGFSPWRVRAKVSLPHLPYTSVLECEFIPHPLNENGWEVTVHLSALSPVEYAQNQALISAALVAPGFEVCNVRMGSMLQF